MDWLVEQQVFLFGAKFKQKKKLQENYIRHKENEDRQRKTTQLSLMFAVENKKCKVYYRQMKDACLLDVFETRRERENRQRNYEKSRKKDREKFLKRRKKIIHI